MSLLPEFLTRREWAHLYRGDQPYAQLIRSHVWVTYADVFDAELASAFVTPDGEGWGLPPDMLPTRTPADDELDIARQFFTAVVDMPARYSRPMRWVFSYSHEVPYFLDAVRGFPTFFGSIDGDIQRASRMWMDGEYMAHLTHVADDTPIDYALALYPIVAPTLHYPD